MLEQACSQVVKVVVQASTLAGLVVEPASTSVAGVVELASTLEVSVELQELWMGTMP